MVDRSDLTKSIGEALEEAVAWHTVGIVADGGKSIGTGCALLWRGCPLILTARHVVEDSPLNGIWFHLRHEGTMKRASLRELWSHPDTRYTTKESLDIKRLHCSNEADLAALEVASETEKQHNVKFFELHEGAATPPVGTVVHMRGFPSDLAKPVAPGIRASFAVMQWGRIQTEPKLDRFDPGSEFLVKYVPADEGKHARGFSGAGAWFQRSLSSKVWHLRLGLAGLCTDYYPRRALLSFLRVEVIAKFLDKCVPAPQQLGE